MFERIYLPSSDRIDRYDEETNTWTTLSNKLSISRGYHCAIALRLHFVY